MTANEKLRFYGLFDAALMPKIWFNLEAWQLPYEPLYRGNYQPIAEAIPYIIELDALVNSDSVYTLLKQGDYHLALFICSSLSLDELTRKLALFYHVEDERGIPYLRRFFDVRFFEYFLKTLSAEEVAYLFDKETTFYHFLSREKDYCRMYGKDSINLTTYIDYSTMTEIKRLHDFLPHFKE